MVRGSKSALMVGREGEPFTHRAAITLHGRRASAREIPSYGAKNIAVRFGTLDLHGVAKTPTWTRLGKTAMPEDMALHLMEPVNWLPDDEIVIASSGWDPTEAEQRRIMSVSEDGMVLTLDEPMEFEHWGELVVCLHPYAGHLHDWLLSRPGGCDVHIEPFLAFKLLRLHSIKPICCLQYS